MAGTQHVKGHDTPNRLRLIAISVRFPTSILQRMASAGGFLPDGDDARGVTLLPRGTCRTIRPELSNDATEEAKEHQSYAGSGEETPVGNREEACASNNKMQPEQQPAYPRQLSHGMSFPPTPGARVFVYLRNGPYHNLPTGNVANL